MRTRCSIAVCLLAVAFAGGAPAHERNNLEYGARHAEWVLYNSNWAGWRNVEAVSCDGIGKARGYRFDKTYVHFLCAFSVPRPRAAGYSDWWQTTFHIRNDLCARCFTLTNTHRITRG